MKAALLNPKIAAAIRGESIEEDEAKKKSKADNKNLATVKSSRKKAENETECNQKKKVTKKTYGCLTETKKKFCPQEYIKKEIVQ